MFTALGAEGKASVENQLKDLKAQANLDDDTYKMLKQIILSGHDGAHPNLPKLDQARADILLEFMKDVLYQLFIRGAKIREADELRKKAIADGKKDSDG